MTFTDCCYVCEEESKGNDMVNVGVSDEETVSCHSGLCASRAEFKHWIYTFVNEKGLDWNHIFEVETDLFLNIIELNELVTAMICAPSREQEAIRKMLVMIDFKNGNVLDYFQHLSKAIAR